MAALSLFGSFALSSPAEASKSSANSTIVESDLEEECKQQGDLPARQQGWARNRFEQCHRYTRVINLYHSQTLEYRGKIEFVFEILAFASYSGRRVDFVLSLEDVGISSQLNHELGYITVNMDGCKGVPNVTCTGETYRTDAIAAWYARPVFDPVIATSTDGSGASPYATVNLDALTTIMVEYRDGITLPYSELTATTRARFDSAGPEIGSAPQHGTVFRDYTPVLELDRRAGSDHRQEAIHVDDAQNNPSRTFPSFVGKSPPGAVGARPLHRLMGSRSDMNRLEARKVCVDVWGPNYATGGLQCDEYPFAVTYEGAAMSTAGIYCGNSSDPVNADWRKWHGSARPIDGAHNGRGGILLSAFFRTNRVLDCDEFHVNVIR
ncbi:hypothetical protein [Micromonospora sp. NPDC007230]|uniref:NucA/NucB deoxyribonuclease domain-containing protein n=1 Tax=Micromonospora sp. NPDC007230 TaxID=3364237 RepID=UPI00369D84E6